MRGSSRLDVFLETVLRLDTPESVAFIERVGAIADNARADAKHSTSQRRGPCLRGRDERPPYPPAAIPVSDDEAEDLGAGVAFQIRMGSQVNPGDGPAFFVGDEKNLV